MTSYYSTIQMMFISMIRIYLAYYLLNDKVRNIAFSGIVCFLLYAGFCSAEAGGCYGYGTSNTEEAHDVIQTTSQDILVAGKTNQNSTDAYLMKFSPGDQTVIWDQTYGTSNKAEEAKAVVQNKGDYFLAGYTKSSGNKDIFIAQIDPDDGTVKNNKILGGSNVDVAHDIIKTRNNNLAITGHTKTTNGSNSVLPFVTVFSMSDTSFTVIREFAYGTSSGNRGHSLTQDSEGDFWVTGYNNNNDGSALIYQLEEDFTNNTSGDVIYKALVNDGNNKQIFESIEEDSGSIIAVGSGKFNSSYEKDGSIGDKAAFALKIDKTTKNPDNAYSPVNQMQEFGTGNTEKAHGLAATDNGYTLTGTNGNSKLFAFQIQSDFTNVNWSQVLGGSSTDYGNAIIEMESDGFLNVGKSQSSDYNNGSGNFFLTRVDQSGGCCCGSSQSLNAVAIDKSGTITNNPSNSSFQIDQSNLSQNQSSLTSPTTSTTSGSFESSSACGALPVKFTSCELSPKGDQQVKVQWRTATETNNDFFTVLRAYEDESFRPVNTVDGQGNAVTSHSYQYTDRVPKAGTYYYKIRQTDYNGNTSTSETEAIRIDQLPQVDLRQIKVNRNGLRVGVRGDQLNNCAVKVFDNRGQLLSQRTLSARQEEQSLRFSLSGRASQVLYIKVIDAKTGSHLTSKKMMSLY